MSGPVGPGRGWGPGVVTAYTLADDESRIREPGSEAVSARGHLRHVVTPRQCDHGSGQIQPVQMVRDYGEV